MTPMTTEFQVRGRSSPARRTFGLLDLMILVVATALSLAWLRERPGLIMEVYLIRNTPSRFFHSLIEFRHFCHNAVPILVPLTFASVAFRVRRPRPSMRRVTSQPGAVACLAASLAFLLYFAMQAASMAAWSVLPVVRPSIGGFVESWEPILSDLGGVAAFAGVAVMGVWLCLAVGRRWRAEPSWVDRLGRALGMAWVAAVPIQISFEILWPLGGNGRI
jgi:hypothetical protein